MTKYLVYLVFGLLRCFCEHWARHHIEAIHKICQCQLKFIPLILLMIRGQDKMNNYFSKYLGRGGWSSWAASPASTQSVAATSGMMRELGPGTMGLDIYPGVQQEIIPGFFKKMVHGEIIICCLYSYFCRVSFRICLKC